MKKDTIIIGTRSSKLALWQADYVADCLRKEYPGLRVEKKLVTTKGDKIINAPLAKIGGKGLFTEEIEAATKAQAAILIRAVELSYLRAMKLLSERYPEVDLSEINEAFNQGLLESAEL